MHGYFRVFSSPDDLHAFSLMDDEHRLLLQSVLHRSRAGMDEAIAAVRRLAIRGDCCKYERCLDGQYYFQIRDDHGRLLASSNLYPDLSTLQADARDVLYMAGGARSFENQDPVPGMGCRLTRRSVDRAAASHAGAR